jgi:hypothetical protein
MIYLVGDKMQNYTVTFFVEGVEVEDGTLHIQAMDKEWAEQVFLLHLNTKEGIPSIYDYYTKPKLVKA